MPGKLIVFALALTAAGLIGAGLAAGQGTETKSFAVQPGDTLAINSDSGRIWIRPSEGTALEVSVQKTSPDPARKNSPEVSLLKKGNTISINASFSGTPGEAVDFEINAPKFLNVTIQGASPQVDISGIQGTVRVQGSGGSITAENLTSTASLVTESGNIIYRSDEQPQGDVRLESTSGNISCEFVDSLNLRSWIRAGGKISWDMDPTLQGTTLEKQLGSSGPLLYAGSLKGNVVVRVKPGLNKVLPAASTQVKPLSASPSQNPAPVVDSSRPAETQAPASNPAIPEVRPTPAPDTSKTAESRPPLAASGPIQEPQRGSSPAEARRPSTAEGQYSLKVNVDSVFLNVSVWERATNRSIAGLQKNDFRVYEDSVEQEISQFLPTEAPFNLLLLMDVSGSTRSFLHLMKQAAIDFTRQINPSDRIAIATFNSQVQLVENFTNDRSAAARAIQRIQSGGGTAFYDALMTCLDRHMRGIEGRSAIVVFTDGVDNQLDGNIAMGSRTRFDELYRKVQEVDTIIYTIFLDTEGQVPTTTRRPARFPRGGGGWPGGRRGGIGLPGGLPFPLPIPQPSPQPSPGPYPRRQDQRAVYDRAREQLMTIAEQTGGRMYSPNRIEELSGVYSEIADDLRIQYQLGYNSTNRTQNGQWRAIRVRIVNHPEAMVRTRKGYYARKESSQ